MLSNVKRGTVAPRANSISTVFSYKVGSFLCSEQKSNLFIEINFCNGIGKLISRWIHYKNMKKLLINLIFSGTTLLQFTRDFRFDFWKRYFDRTLDIYTK